MADGTPEPYDLPTALRQLLADVTSGRDSAWSTFNVWCREHQLDIEFMASFGVPHPGEDLIEPYGTMQAPGPGVEQTTPPWRHVT